MQIMDLCIATKYLEYAEVSQWNMTRQIMLCTLKPYLKKKDMTAQEFFPLPLDDDNSEHTTEMSNEELEWFKKFKDNYAKKQKDSN
jgi:hypothetical protein